MGKKGNAGPVVAPAASFCLEDEVSVLCLVASASLAEAELFACVEDGTKSGLLVLAVVMALFVVERDISSQELSLSTYLHVKEYPYVTKHTIIR